MNATPPSSDRGARDAPLGWLEVCVVAVLFTAASLILTLPLARHLPTSVPSDLVDTLLTTWVTAWDADRLRHGLTGVWDAPIYFPYLRTLAFSENLFGLAFLVAPVYWVSGNPLLTYNIGFLFSFALAGVGMYVLVRQLTGSRSAAAVAGAYYAFCPYRMAQAQLSHIQMLATGWLPLALCAVHGYFRGFARRWLGLFVVACCFQALSNSYLAYFMVVPIAVVLAFEIAGSRERPRRWAADLAIAATIAVAALAPVAAQYHRAQIDYGHLRSAGEIEIGSADVRAYFVSVSGVWRHWLPLPQGIFGESEKELFPGVVAPLLAGFALHAAARGRPRGYRDVGVYAVVALAGFVLSLGPVVRVWGAVLTRHGPYAWLQQIVPGMGGMRTPSRFVVVVTTGLSVLAGVGALQVLRRVRPRLRPFATVVLLAGVIADGWAVPIPVVRYSPRGRPEDRAVADWLRDVPPGAVLHLPLNTAQFQELHYQYATLFHPHPLVNGFTGWDSPLQQLLRHPRGPMYDYVRYPATVTMLRALGVRYVIVHPGDYNVTQLADGELTATLDGLRQSGQVLQERHFLEVQAFELAPIAEPRAAVALGRISNREFRVEVSQQSERAAFLVDGDNDSRWIGLQDGGSAIAARFDTPRDVARVELQLAERSLWDFPRELQIDAEDAAGGARTLYRASPYREFLAAFLRDRAYPSIWIDLPPNDTIVLRIRDVATYDTWWSVHELRLWGRR